MKKIIICLAIILAACSCEKIESQIFGGGIDTCTIENAVNPELLADYDGEIKSVNTEIFVYEFEVDELEEENVIRVSSYPLNYGEKKTVTLDERTRYIVISLKNNIRTADSSFTIALATDFIKVSRNLTVTLDKYTLDSGWY